jgi:hypothetical protein
MPVGFAVIGGSTIEQFAAIADQVSLTLSPQVDPPFVGH